MRKKHFILGSIISPFSNTFNSPQNHTLNPDPATMNNIDNPGPRRSQRLKSKSNATPDVSLESAQNSSYNSNNEMHQKNKKTETTSVDINKSTQSEKPKKKNRKREITYWNPPYNISLATNIGKQFLSLINKHFPANSELSSAFNRHTIKISYSTTQNISDIIAAHNKSILNRQDDKAIDKCNCRNECPLPGQCREKAVIYQAEINGAIYIGMTKTEARSRIRRHRHSF